MTDTLIRKQVTREEYRQLPEGPPYFELIGGELIEMTKPLRRHYRVLSLLVETLNPLARSLGGESAMEPNLYLPSTEDVYHPDLVYVGPDKVVICREDGIWGVPDVVCEVLSPSTERRDRMVKLRECERAGVPHFWLISPEPPTAVEEWVLTGGRYVRVNALESPATWQPHAFPGLEFRLAEFDAEVAQKPPRA